MKKLVDNEWLDIGLKVGIPIGVYFFVIKPILVSINLLPDKQEQVQNESDQQAQNQQQQLGVYYGNENHSYSATVLDGISVTLRTATDSWFGYDWDSIAEALAWLPGMTAADGRYFLGTFAKKNGYTLHRWYLDKFTDTTIITSFTWDNVKWEPGWGSSGGRAAYDYSPFYEKMGINESNARSFSWSEVVNKFVSYVYSLTGVTRQ